MASGAIGTHTGEWRICEVCGSSFFVNACWIRGATHKGGGKYCSVNCKVIASRGRKSPNNRRVKLKCVICGAEFEVQAFRVGTAVCCSNECRFVYVADILRKDTTSRRDWGYSHTRRTWARKVLERDDYTCQLCGSNENLEAHHIFGVTENPELAKELWNGVTYCQSCHKKVETYRRGEVLV